MRVWCAFVAAVLMADGCAHGPAPRFDARAASASCRQVLPPDSPTPTWIEPTSPDTRGRLSQWCDTVGPVFFKPHAADSATPVVGTLAIVAWNIHEGSGEPDELIRRLRAGEFTSGEPIDHFILLLQEAIRHGDGVPLRVPRGYPTPRRIVAATGSSEHDVRRFAEEGFAVLYAPSMRNGESAGAGEDRGNAIVSTLPLADPTVIELPLERQRRVVVAATIAVRDHSARPWRLNVVDVHLDTALAPLHGGPLAARRRQAAALLDAVDGTLAVAESSTVVAGDLNTWMGEREPAYRLLRRDFPEPRRSDTGATWAGPLGLRARLDHIFFRGPQTVSGATRLPTRFGSDHYPLLTVIRF